MMRHTLSIGQQTLTSSPRVRPCGIEHSGEISSHVVGHTLLAGILPAEQAVRRDAIRQNAGQRGHLQVCFVGNEATAVAATLRTDGESHHVAALQLEAPDAVIELRGFQRLHVTAAAVEVEIAARLSLEVILGVDGQRSCCAVGQDERTLIVDSNLAVLVDDGIFSIDFKEYQIEGLWHTKTKLIGFFKILFIILLKIHNILYIFYFLILIISPFKLESKTFNVISPTFKGDNSVFLSSFPKFFILIGVFVLEGAIAFTFIL